MKPDDGPREHLMQSGWFPLERESNKQEKFVSDLTSGHSKGTKAKGGGVGIITVSEEEIQSFRQQMSLRRKWRKSSVISMTHQ